MADNLVGDGSEHVLLGIPDPCQCYWIFRSDSQCPKLILVPKNYPDADALDMRVSDEKPDYGKRMGKNDIHVCSVKQPSPPLTVPV
jgi:hypothetical protein